MAESSDDLPHMSDEDAEKMRNHLSNRDPVIEERLNSGEFDGQVAAWSLDGKIFLGVAKDDEVLRKLLWDNWELRMEDVLTEGIYKDPFEHVPFDSDAPDTRSRITQAGEYVKRKLVQLLRVLRIIKAPDNPPDRMGS